ncbi:hypothetical protein LguiB_018489 [Lonicera macranthoides]
MDPAHPDRLEGDQEEVTFTDAQGVLRCSPHHDDWADLDWYDEDGINRGRAVIYRDITRAAPVPDVPWLLMEPVSHEIRRRSLVCLPFVYLSIPLFLLFPAYIFLNNVSMHACLEIMSDFSETRTFYL